ncbi:MAG: serine/threonine protein kinase [Deltaproteobacteria bacterium]|nr:serine/threonine protein kinase [Deltaproteobacteria bacterium]
MANPGQQRAERDADEGISLTGLASSELQVIQAMVDGRVGKRLLAIDGVWPVYFTGNTIARPQPGATLGDWLTRAEPSRRAALSVGAAVARILIQISEIVPGIPAALIHPKSLPWSGGRVYVDSPAWIEALGRADPKEIEGRKLPGSRSEAESLAKLVLWIATGSPNGKASPDLPPKVVAWIADAQSQDPGRRPTAERSAAVLESAAHAEGIEPGRVDLPVARRGFTVPAPEAPAPAPRQATVRVDDSGGSDPYEEPTDSRARPTADEALVGSILHGYRVIEKVGEGAQSRVFRGEHVHLGRKVAIKVLRGAIGSSAHQRARLLREARVLSDLSHPHVVRVHDFGETTGGLPFIVLEWIDGVSMRRALKTAMPTPRRAMAWAGQLASALAAAHSRGVTHRDLKPGNVMVTGSGESTVLKLIDFGLAKVVDADQPLTGFGDVIGTPQYIAPESLVTSAEVGPAADVYALGAVMFELITGHPVFEGTLPEVLEAHRSQNPPRLDNSIWNDWVQRAMAKDPAKRPTAAQLFDEIRNASEGGDLEPTALATMALLAEDALLDGTPMNAAPMTTPTPASVDSKLRPAQVESLAASRRRLALAAGAALLATMASFMAVRAVRQSRTELDRAGLIVRAAKVRRAQADKPSAEMAKELDELEALIVAPDADVDALSDRLSAFEPK